MDYYPIPTLSFSMGRMFVCLFVQSVTQKQMIPVFKLGIGNDLGMS